MTAAKRMNTLIGDLLAYTNARTHEGGPASVVDSGRVLNGVLETLRAPIERIRRPGNCRGFTPGSDP